MKRWGIVVAAGFVVLGVVVFAWMRTAPTDQPEQWISRQYAAGDSPENSAGIAPMSANQSEPWEGLSQRIAAAALSSGLDAGRAASLGDAAIQVIDAAAAADHRALLALSSIVGGKDRSQDLHLLRTLWRRGPEQIQPTGWQTWTDAQIMSYMYKNAQPWRSINLGAVSVQDARRHANGHIDPRSSSLPMSGAAIEPRTLEIPDLDRALSSGARAVLIEFDFIDAEGVHRTAAIWLCELSPGLWCLAGSRISGEQRPGEFIL